MKTFAAGLLAAIIAYPWYTVLIAYFLMSHILAALPSRAQRWPLVGWLIAVLHILSYLTHSDQEGTLKWPGVRKAIIDAVVTVGAPPIRSQSGHVRVSLLLALVGWCTLGAMLSAYLHGCTPAQGKVVASLAEPAVCGLCAAMRAAHGGEATEDAHAAFYETPLVLRIYGDGHTAIVPSDAGAQ